MNGGPTVSLDEARRRLKELGYLDGRVDRFLFRRAFEGRGGLLLPAVLFAAFAAALASAAAVESAEPGFGQAPGSFVALLAHLFFANVAPAALGGLAAAFLADRSRAPGAAATAVAFAALVGICFLWGAGTYSLARELPARALLWGVPVGLCALLAADGARAGFLARAYAHSRALPARRRGRIVVAGAALVGIAAALLLFGRRSEAAAAEPPRPEPRPGQVVVVAADGLGRVLASDAVPPALAALAAKAGSGWWTARGASPPELWTDLATGEPSSRHGVRALERVRPRGSRLSVRPPFGTRWYLRGVGPAAGLVASAPVSSEDRRRLAFWEVAASGGLPTLAVGWWASAGWPGAAVVGNEELLSGADSGLDVDRRARAMFEGRRNAGQRIQTVYLPGLDILRDDPSGRGRALAELAQFLESEEARVASGETLVVLAADSHAASGAPQRMLVFDGVASRTLRITPEDVAPSILARAGVPVAKDLPGRPVAALFRAGSLDAGTVASYGARVAPAPARRSSDREYLEKLKSLGYLN